MSGALSSILEGELAATISEALIDANIPFDITINRTVPGEPDPETPWIPGEPTVTAYSCKGFIENYREDFIAGGVVQSDDVKVVVLATTLSIDPDLSDTVTARGITYSIISISPDPAIATIALQARA